MDHRGISLSGHFATYGSRRKRFRNRLLLVSALAALLVGCVSDTMLLQENSAVALRSVRFKARNDLQCPQVKALVLSEQEVPGAPWGYLYSDYRIQAEGCGQRAVYEAECRDEQLCKTTRNPK